MCIEEFLTFWLITQGILIILDKYNVMSELGEFASSMGSKLLFGVSECRFCFEHHTGLIVLSAYLIFLSFTPIVDKVSIIIFLYPLMSAALTNIISRK